MVAGGGARDLPCSYRVGAASRILRPRDLPGSYRVGVCHSNSALAGDARASSAAAHLGPPGSEKFYRDDGAPDHDDPHIILTAESRAIERCRLRRSSTRARIVILL